MLSIKWWNFSSPTNCPTWFIPVPWNAEFAQPWFCVAKYEMALERDLIWTWELNSTYDWNTWSWSTTSRWTWSTWVDWKIVSASWKYPIAYITQIQAIAACKSIGWHLITNNEWMTIARNIEANPVNWFWWIVWTNHISNWVSNSPLWCWVWTTKSIYADLPNSRATKTWPWWNANCDEKRQLKLSNWEVIRDLAWNVWEHVNKANTIDWINYNVWWTSISWVSVWNDWEDNWIYNSLDMKKYGSIYWYWMSNGMWNVYYWSWANNNIFLRSGSSGYANPAGVFVLSLGRGSATQTNTVGFRCSY